jgi:carboxymethylenebutenolidase
MYEDVASLLPKLTRREIVVTSLGAGFALAVQPIVAQTVITTDTNGLTAGEVKIPVGDGDIPAYRAMPASGTIFPTILVVQEVFGVHEHIKDVCRRLAKLGYLAVAPALYARQGDPSTIAEISRLIKEIVSRVPDQQVMRDLDATVAWAAKNRGDISKLGITGFCWGGRIVWLYAAHNPSVKAGGAWYGRLVGDKNEMTPSQPVDVAGKIKGAVLGLYGGQDQGIPLTTVDQMRAALKAAGNRSEIIVYPNSQHGFYADYRPSYDKQAAPDAWSKLLDWYKKHGVA